MQAVIRIADAPPNPDAPVRANLPLPSPPGRTARGEEPRPC